MPNLAETASLLALGLAAGCSYDWSVAPDPVVGIDAGPGSDAAAPDPDPTEAGPTDAAPTRSCAELADQLPAARAAAKACTALTAACTVKVRDECQCRVSLWAANADAVSHFQELVAQFEAQGCAASGCACLAESAGTCLAAGGGAYACSP